MHEEPEVKNFLPEDSRPRMTPCTILFLDSVENVERLTEAFKDAGYAVVGATTIEDAWACLEGKDRVDVIVCAPHLENGSMFEFLQDVRNSKLHEIYHPLAGARREERPTGQLHRKCGFGARSGCLLQHAGARSLQVGRAD
jgi:CheY-like chemotaxis protein